MDPSKVVANRKKLRILVEPQSRAEPQELI
jgi:hypothetical protein